MSDAKTVDRQTSLWLAVKLNAQAGRCYETALSALHALHGDPAFKLWRVRGSELSGLRYVEGFVAHPTSGGVTTHGWLETGRTIIDAGIVWLVPHPRGEQYFAGAAYTWAEVRAALDAEQAAHPRAKFDLPFVWGTDAKGDPMRGMAHLRHGRCGEEHTGYVQAAQAAVTAVRSVYGGAYNHKLDAVEYLMRTGAVV